MKKLSNYTLLLCLLAFMSCEVEDPIGLQSSNISEATVPVVTATNQSFFDIFDIENAYASVDLDLVGNVPVERVEVYQSYQGGAPELLTSLTDLPGTFDVSLQEAAALAGLNVDNLQPNETFTYTFLVHAQDGRTFATNTVLNVPTACGSNLVTNFTYRQTNMYSDLEGLRSAGPITGQGSFARAAGSAIEYSIAPGAAFGAWGALYGSGEVEGVSLRETCGELAFVGSDQYGDTYQISNVRVNGNRLSFDWSNTYQEGGSVELTRTDGEEWPDYLF